LFPPKPKYRGKAVNKITREPKQNTKDTIGKKWCRRFFCLSAAFALGLTKSQPYGGKDPGGISGRSSLISSRDTESKNDELVAQDHERTN
jgi:hypothetical protein